MRFAAAGWIAIAALVAGATTAAADEVSVRVRLRHQEGRGTDPAPGLLVSLVQERTFGSSRVLAAGVTDEDGEVDLRYRPPRSLGFFGGPDLSLEVRTDTDWSRVRVSESKGYGWWSWKSWTDLIHREDLDGSRAYIVFRPEDDRDAYLAATTHGIVQTSLETVKEEAPSFFRRRDRDVMRLNRRRGLSERINVKVPDDIRADDVIGREREAYLHWAVTASYVMNADNRLPTSYLERRWRRDTREDAIDPGLAFEKGATYFASQALFQDRWSPAAGQHEGYLERHPAYEASSRRRAEYRSMDERNEMNVACALWDLCDFRYDYEGIADDVSEQSVWKVDEVLEGFLDYWEWRDDDDHRRIRDREASASEFYRRVVTRKPLRFPWREGEARNAFLLNGVYVSKYW